MTDALAYSTRRHKIRLWKIANGIPRMVDPQQARQHVLKLMDLGLTETMIARAAGLNQQTISNIVHAVYTTTQPEISAAILAVDHHPHPNQFLVPAIGGRRRLRALNALGWPGHEVARRTGTTAHALNLSVRGATMTYRRWKALADIYEQLSGTPGPSAEIATRSRTLGHVPPLAWEGVDIDHPHAQPDWAAAGIKLADRPVCPNGHTYTPANTKRTADGRRACRTCRRTNDATAKRNARRRAAQAS